MINRLAIYLLLTGCLVFGGIVFIELLPAATDEPVQSELPRRPNMPPAVRRPQSARLEELLATVLADRCSAAPDVRHRLPPTMAEAPPILPTRA